MHTDDKKTKTIKAAKHKRRTIFLFIVECVVFLLLLMVIFFLYELSKLNIKELDQDKIVTNAAERPTETSKTTAVIVTETNEDGSIIEISIPETEKEEEASFETTTEEENTRYYKAPFGDEGYTTLVIFGVDTRSSDGDYLEGANSDVMIITSINNETGSIRMCSVYRDTYMKLYGHDTYGKANLGYCAYDIYEAINTLNMNLDLNITEYVSVDWTAAIKVIEVLGGAIIKLNPEFYEVNSAASETGKVPYLNGLIQELVNSTGIDSMAIPKEYFDGREFLANGVQSVAYMRLRYTDSDLYRTKRQREIINQMLERSKNVGLETLLKVYDVASEYVELSLTETEILGLVYNIANYKVDGTHGYPFRLYSGEDYTGSMKYNMITIDLVQNVKDLHKFLYDDDDYQPTNTIYELDEDLRHVAGFDENWKPEFNAPNFYVIDAGNYN